MKKNNASVIADALKNSSAVDRNNLQDGTVLKIESGIGIKSSKSRQDTSYSVSQANQLTAGGNIRLSSSEGDIHLQNTHMSATDTIALNSARDILLEAGHNRQQADGKNSSMGVSVGVGASIGAKTGFYIYGDIGVSSGKNHLDAQTHSQTTLQSDKLQLTSKRDTTLLGAQATANRIDADIGGKLSIISPQDKIEQSISQSGANLHVQGGLGSVWEVSGGVNSSSGSGQLNAVSEQLGLFAGKGGYHIKADSVDLQGGAITSSADKEHNQLNANSITFKDIENSSSFHSSNASIGGGVSGINSGSGSPSGDKNFRPSFTPSMPQFESGSDQSTTHATLSPGQITINGKETSVEELGIHSDIDTAHSKVNELPDLQQIMDKQQAVADATATIATAINTFNNDMSRKATEKMNQAREQAEANLQANDAQKWTEYQEAKKAGYGDIYLAGEDKAFNTSMQEAMAWSIGGSKSRLLETTTSAITGMLGGQSNLQIVANAMAPYAAEQIGKQLGGKDKPTAEQLVAHAILGATLAYINGGNVTAGAASAVAAEASASYLSQIFTDEAVVRDISSAIATVIGGGIGGSLHDAQISGTIGKNAAENNWLSKAEVQAMLEKLVNAETTEEKEAIYQEYAKLSKTNSLNTAKKCQQRNSLECLQDIQSMKEGLAFAENEQQFNEFINTIHKPVYIEPEENLTAIAAGDVAVLPDVVVTAEKINHGERTDVGFVEY